MISDNLVTWLLPLLTLAFNAGVLVMTLRTKITKVECLELINKQLDTHEDYCPMAKELRHKFDSQSGAVMKGELEHLSSETKALKNEVSRLREDLHSVKNMLVKVHAKLEVG